MYSLPRNTCAQNLSPIRSVFLACRSNKPIHPNLLIIFVTIVLMRGYYEDARKRTKELNNIRFVIEETYQYEVGYLMHEMYEK